MKKTSKILSLLVAFCMTFSMFMGITAFAEDLTVAAYEADTDFIIVDFAEEVTLTEENVILRKGGVDVPFTVASADHSRITDDLRDNYSYKIVPEGGVIAGEEYKITLLNVANAAGTKTLASWAKTFTVTVVNEGLALDNANAKDSFGTTSAMYQSNATNPDGDTSKVVATTDGTSSYAIQLARAFGADVQSGILANAATPTESNEMTVKVKMGIVGSAIQNGSQWNLSLGLIYDPAKPNFTYKALNGNFFNLYYNPKYNTSRVEIYSADGTAASTSEFKRISDSRSSLPGYGDMETAEGVEVKLSIRDNLLRGYVGGTKVVDYTFADSVADTAFALIRINATAKANATGATIHLSDFVASKAAFADATPDAFDVEPEPEPEPEPTPEVNPDLLVDWDADLDFITLDFEEELGSIDATLTQAGTQIPVTVGKADHSQAKADFNTRATYKIKPVTGGLTRDLPYTLHVNAVTADGEEQIVAWNKTFKVEVLEEGLTIDGTNKVYSAKASGTTSGTVTNIEGTDDINITYEGTNASNNLISKAVTPDVDASKSIGTLTAASAYTASDYTVKVTFKNVTGTPYANIGLAKSYSTKQTSFNHNWFRGTALRLQVQPKDASNLSKGIGTNAIAYLDANTVANYDANPNYTQGDSDMIANLDTTEGIELKLSVKNEFARAYINGGKIFDYVDEGAGGAASIYFAPKSSDGASVDIVDFVVTKAVAITDDIVAFEFSAAEVTGGSFASGTVSVATTLTNNTAFAKDIFAVCALYDATDVMKNIVISDTTSAATGETPLAFDNITTNGATYAKIFIWDSATALNPWFPAIIAE